MKKYLSILAALLLSVCFIFAGCGADPKLVNSVSSNGGRVVTADEYVFFANTFVDYTTLSGEMNKESNVEYNAIFKIKTDENGYTFHDDDNRVTEVSKVYSKMAGFNNSNMFIVGNYLYFTSPNVHKENKTGNDKFDLTTLFRIKVDGTNFKEILTTETTQGKFFLVTDEHPYLLIFDNNKISKLEIKDNLGSQTTLVENVLDVVFPSNYSTLSNIFYTKDLSETDKASGLTGNYLYRYNLANKANVEVQKNEKEMKLITFENNTLYYRQADENGDFSYYSSKFMNGIGEEVVWTIPNTEDAVSDFKVINENAVVYKAQSKLYIGKAGGNFEVLVNEDATIELVNGEYVYYSTSNGIYRKSYKNDEDVQTIAEIKNIKQGAMEIAGEYIYFYAQMTDNSTNTYYAHRANIKTPGLSVPEQRVECIASVAADDLTTNSTED